MAHFRILGNDKYAPYGTSVLEGARRIFRQLTLIEDAMMSYRIVRSPERRVFKIEVGNIPPQDVEQYVQRVMTQMKRNQVIDPDTGRVDLRYNPLSVEEDYFLPVRNGIGSDITSLAGGQYTGDIDDVKYLREKLFSALKVPAAYLVAGEEAEDKTALSQKDVRFSRTIQRLQRSVVSELEKVGIIHLYTLGFKNKDLISFKLRLNNPSRIAELQELEYWRTKFDIAAAATEGFFSKRWISENIFNLSEADNLRNQREMYYDKMFAADLEKTAEEVTADDTGLDAGGFDAAGEEGLGELELGADEELGGEELGGEEAGAGEEDMLLATPGNRDESIKIQRGDKTTTTDSKGKWYKPVSKELDKRRHLAPKKKSMKKQYSDRLASSSRENIFPDMNAFSRASKGIYENIKSTYSKEEVKILNSNDEVYRVLSQLEKKMKTSKLKHNKKRNTAFLYESLVRELTLAIVNKKLEQKKLIEQTLVKFFKKGTNLQKDLDSYKAIYETKNASARNAEKLLMEAKHKRFSDVNEKELFNEQTSLIDYINKNIGKQAFFSFSSKL